MPTAAYIARYLDAYSNPNIVSITCETASHQRGIDRKYCLQSTWEQASGGAPKPKNRLVVSFNLVTVDVPVLSPTPFAGYLLE
jgi:hypothetical protein